MMTDPAASGPGTHLDPDQMADLFEGLLDTTAADRAQAHLATCPVCSADFALITGESDLSASSESNGLSRLSELLPPVPIPQDVVTRIEAALYREPPLKVAPAAAPVGHHATAPPRRRFRIRLGALAGATLVIAGGIGVVTALNSGGGSTKSSSAASGASSENPDGSHVAGQAPSGGAMSPQVGRGPDSSAGALDPGEASIEQQAEALLGKHAATPAIGAGPECVPEGVADGAKPLAKTQTRYQGEAAWLLVYAKPGSATLAEVYVVAVNACTSGNLGQVADHLEITRP
ncbi:hypothetical protein Caci_9041 [Catenulispora acidiphila DSM 44928]|uniref:Zinc-finger domain-containing protein n=1 Tax=Catenulispora acidiphila (strain DSM 44928 / JCM 14897 / NBRC 102108 / NRRL B-24433 / ID139908) TaxID=479433 RepID=C7Q5P3_CATAD|nr:hypothetical protein [Catenulispora acidiphila]ACU77854.1 hypothetical protein Caci_9041 [Catenulispora acidiphila DSM 44928]